MSSNRLGCPMETMLFNRCIGHYYTLFRHTMSGVVDVDTKFCNSPFSDSFVVMNALYLAACAVLLVHINVSLDSYTILHRASCLCVLLRFPKPAFPARDIQDEWCVRRCVQASCFCKPYPLHNTLQGFDHHCVSCTGPPSTVKQYDPVMTRSPSLDS